MLKETETEETIGFFVTFFLIIGGISIGGGALAPLATPMMLPKCNIFQAKKLTFGFKLPLTKAWMQIPSTAK